MSWLVNSIANSLKLDDDDNNHTDTNPNPPSPPPAADPSAQPRGVKEDLSEISKTLSRQFWGVASFLAPPAPEHTSEHQIDDPDADSDPDSDVVAGFRSDLSEIGGRFRSGISKLSSNKAVTEFTKIIATNFRQFGSEELESIEEFAQRGVVGVTEEVVAFARNLALHPETWIDFPLPDDEDDEEQDEDFDMSDAQQEHALAVERLAPALAALRIELCPGYMSEGCFWKIYFVLVHPRLSRADALLLSSPQIVKTRAMLTHDIKPRIESKQYIVGRGTEASEAASSANEEHLVVPSNNNPESESVNVSVVEPEASEDIADIEMDKHPLASTEVPVIDKQVIQEVSAPQTNNAKSLSAVNPVTASAEDFDEDGDDWLKEEPSDIGGSSGTAIPLEDPEDVSFSDLEEDDDDEVPIKFKKVVYPSNTSKESNDWLDIEDIDVA